MSIIGDADAIGAARRALFGRREQDAEATHFTIEPGRRAPLPAAPVEPEVEPPCDTEPADDKAACIDCTVLSTFAVHGGLCIACYTRRCRAAAAGGTL